MTIAVRRRLAAGGGLLSAALVGGLLVTASPAAAGARTDDAPFNDETAARITFTTDTDVPMGAVVEFDGPVPGPSDVFTAMVDRSQPSGVPPTFRQPSVQVDLADPDYTTAGADGPANPGTYAVRFRDGALTGPVDESCTGCLTVLTRTQPTTTGATPSGLSAGESAQVVLAGTGFARDTRVEFLRPDGTVDPTVTAVVPTGTTTATRPAGAATPTSLRRQVAVQPGAAVGPRTLRLTNTDARTSLCSGCFTVRGAAFAGVQPDASTNTASDTDVPVVFTPAAGAPFPADAVPTLAYEATGTGSSTRQGLSLAAKRITREADGRITAVFDLVGAAPGAGAYVPTVTSGAAVSTSPDRFTVRQPSTPTVTGAAPATQAAGTSQTVTVSGTGFAKGAVVTLTGGNGLMPLDPITATSVEYVSPTTLRAVLAVPAAAPTGTRNIVVTNTDGQSGTANGGYTLTAPAPATASPTASASGTPTPSRSATPTASATPSRSATATATPTVTPTRSATPTPSATGPAPTTPRLSLPRTTITSQESATVVGVAEPGSIVELLAYSRPRTTYVVVRRGVVGESGSIEFEVGPSGNTRMFLRRTDVGGGRQADSPSVVLTVRTSINLKVTRTGVRTYRFTGSTLPKRPGQTVNIRYRSGSEVVVAAKTRVAANGTYNVVRRFTGGGTFDLFTDTGVDINNAAGLSRPVRTTLR